MSLDDVNRVEWTPLVFEIILDGFQHKLDGLTESVANLTLNNVRRNINCVLKLSLEWVLFNLHLFIAIHKNLCEDSLLDLMNDDDQLDEIFDTKIESIKILFTLNDQNIKFRELAKRISPGLHSHRNLMDRIFILASTWPALNGSQMQRSLKVYHMFKDMFGCQFVEETTE